jgi:formate dehydrogenase major subunit
VVYTTFHHAKSKVNRVTSDLSDWATNCPEYKVTAVEVARVEQETEAATAKQKKKKQKALEMA